ncbi:hypothetical protein BX600DRAFT_541602 [Xylariales sp. PMI_506]|nr:hypothetical protein BX600DRAFT_541602 [Xylariales sp. PMI_506]
MEPASFLERPQRDNFVLEVRHGSADVTREPTPDGWKGSAKLVHRPSLRTNFSYPRPEGHISCHESADSRSSLASNGSMPGMTDASDSEASTDDDYHYNASASELWDSFWPSGVDKTHHAQGGQGPAGAIQNPPVWSFFPSGYTLAQPQDLEDDTITIKQNELTAEDPKSSQWPFTKTALSQPPQVQRQPSFPMYPRVSPDAPTRPAPLPPRSSSLISGDDLPPRRPLLKGSRSIANLKSLKSNKSNGSLYLAPPSSISNATIMHATSMPGTPSGKAPKLRSSASAYNIRSHRKQSSQSSLSSQYNAGSPQMPSIPRLPSHVRPLGNQSEQLISVFEPDSDSESESDNSGFAKRFARGLQTKKSAAAAEKRSSSDKKASIASLPAEAALPSISADASPDSPSRKRGGSLGRILGLKSR